MCHITGICDDCGLECESTTQDNGIGSYEFWGDRGTHHDYVEASPCCGAEVVEGGNKLVRISNHIARQNHKTGNIKVGDSYKLVVTRCWRHNGPSWIRTRKIKVNLFPKFNFLENVR